ncbi:MAG TPA: hypothetical protein VGF67_11100 [Ktedonobacteraceae bacterium]|jgi:hypothetical protein
MDYLIDKLLDLWHFVRDPFYYRPGLKTSVTDISFLGGVIILLFYTRRDLWLTSISLPDPKPGLTIGGVITLWNLFLATFPLTLAMCIIIAVVVGGGFGPFFMTLGVPIVLILCLALSAYLGLGSIPGNTVHDLLFGHPVHSCRTVSSGDEAVTTYEQIPSFNGFPSHTIPVTRWKPVWQTSCSDVTVGGLFHSPGGPVGLVFTIGQLFWQIYGARTFFLAILLSIYIYWSIFTKLLGEWHLAPWPIIFIIVFSVTFYFSGL